MNILWIGVFDGRSWRAEEQIVEAMLRLPNVAIRRVNMRAENVNWERVAARTKKWADVVMLQNGKRFPTHGIQYFAAPVVYWATEASLRVSRRFLAAQHPPDYVMCHSVQVLRFANEQNLPACRVHNAYDPRQYYAMARTKMYDVAVLGSRTKRRRAVLRRVMPKVSARWHVMGSYNHAQACRIYNESKVVLHIHAIGETYLPSRLWETLPTTGALLIEDMGDNWDPAIGSGCFETFTGRTSLCRGIERLLRDENYRENLVTRANAVARSHTWDARAKQFKQILSRV